MLIACFQVTKGVSIVQWKAGANWCRSQMWRYWGGKYLIKSYQSVSFFFAMAYTNDIFFQSNWNRSSHFGGISMVFGGHSPVPTHMQLHQSLDKISLAMHLPWSMAGGMTTTMDMKTKKKIFILMTPRMVSMRAWIVASRTMNRYAANSTPASCILSYWL